MRHTGIVAAVLPVLVAATLVPRGATACSIAAPEAWAADPAEVGVDTAAPTGLTVAVERVNRGTGPDREGCGYGASSCDDMGSIALAVQASDDRTPPESMGYELTVVEGEPPDFGGMPLPGTYVRPAWGLVLSWVDGDTDLQEALDFTLEVRAVDRAGNRSEPVQVRVTDPGSGGCQGGRGDAGSLWPVLTATIATVFAWSRRRRTGR